MAEENRDRKRRLRVPYFVKLIREYSASRKYVPIEFKRYVESLGVLTAADYDTEQNGYQKWKHRIDRAAQKVFTDI